MKRRDYDETHSCPDSGRRAGGLPGPARRRGGRDHAGRPPGPGHPGGEGHPGPGHLGVQLLLRGVLRPDAGEPVVPVLGGERRHPVHRRPGGRDHHRVLPVPGGGGLRRPALLPQRRPRPGQGDRPGLSGQSALPRPGVRPAGGVLRLRPAGTEPVPLLRQYSLSRPALPPELLHHRGRRERPGDQFPPGCVQRDLPGDRAQSHPRRDRPGRRPEPEKLPVPEAGVRPA